MSLEACQILQVTALFLEHLLLKSASLILALSGRRIFQEVKNTYSIWAEAAASDTVPC